MRLLVHEFETGGGLDGGPIPPTLAREGAAMRAALLADLLCVPGIELLATADPRIAPPTPPGAHIVPAVASARELRRAAGAVDAVWLIAPETGGTLARYTAAIEASRRRLVGCGAAAVCRAANRQALACMLAARGIATPATLAVPCGAGPDAVAARMAFPIVIKTAVGAGCEGVALARDAGELREALALARRVAGPGDVLAQEYIAGAAASISLLCDGRRALPLSMNAQHIRAGVPFAYDGGETPFRHPLSGCAADCAAAACEAVGGLTGWVGVDVVLTDTTAVVIEVNPRLTTSYLGVRAALDTNVAALVLAACEGRLPAHAPRPSRRVRFSAGGVVVVEEAL